MIRFIHNVPMEVCIAFSGGVDSLAVAHFLKRGGRKITLLHFNHGCQYSDRIQAECETMAQSLGLPIVIGHAQGERSKGQSLEDFWRRSRYRFMREYCKAHEKRLVVAHHLNDSIEGWIFSSLHGTPKLIPVYDDVLIRPFLTTPKAEFIKYCERHGLTPVHDEFNFDMHVTRNFIRKEIIPAAYKVNPGLEKVIRKMYLTQTSM